MLGLVAVDESYFGAPECIKHADEKLIVGGGACASRPLLDLRDRETNRDCTEVVEQVHRESLHHFVADHPDCAAIGHGSTTPTMRRRTGPSSRA